MTVSFEKGHMNEIEEEIGYFLGLLEFFRPAKRNLKINVNGISYHSKKGLINKLECVDDELVALEDVRRYPISFFIGHDEKSDSLVVYCHIFNAVTLDDSWVCYARITHVNDHPVCVKYSYEAFEDDSGISLRGVEFKSLMSVLKGETIEIQKGLTSYKMGKLGSVLLSILSVKNNCKELIED